MLSSKHITVTIYGIHCEFSTSTVQCISGVVNFFFSTKDSESLSTDLSVFSLIKDPYLEERTEK